MQVVSEEPVPPGRLCTTIPLDLQTICQKCLEKDPRKRYPDAEALAEDLRRFLAHEPIQARPIILRERLWRWCRRNPALAALAALVMLTLLAGTTISSYFGIQASLSAREARRNEQCANEQAQAADQEKRKAQRQAATLALSQGQTLCERGDVGRGMLWMAHGLGLAPDDGADLQRVFRLNLASWHRQVHPLQATLPHKSWVNAAVFSANGQMIATASDDRTARLWRTATGEPVGAPLQHPGYVYAVAFSPDGKTLVTGSWDHTVRLWNVATGQPFGQVMRHGDKVTAVAFSRDNRTILSTGEDHTGRLWNAATGQPLGKPLKHQSTVVMGLFSPDGLKALTASVDRTARLWNAATGDPIGQPLVHQHAVMAIAFSPNGRAILTGSADGTARLWNTETTQPFGSIMAHQAMVQAVAFSPNGLLAVTGSADNTARLWDASSGKALVSPMLHQGEVTQVAFSPNSQTMLTGSADNAAPVELDHRAAASHPAAAPGRADRRELQPRWPQYPDRQPR